MTANNVTVVEHPPLERGPKNWAVLGDEERTLLDTVKPEDFQILQTIVARLVVPGPLAKPELGLEVIREGPYKGVIFNVTNFEVQPGMLKNGMVPVRFQVRIYAHPTGFVQDAAFDDYAREVFIAWLSYIQTHEYRTLAVTEPHPTIQ
jgi:hypothetical protein